MSLILEIFSFREMDNLFVEYEFVQFGSYLFAWQINFSWKTRLYSLNFKPENQFCNLYDGKKTKITSFWNTLLNIAVMLKMQSVKIKCFERGRKRLVKR